MISYHNISELQGKVASSILDMYKIDYKNLSLASIIAAFHRAYGLRDEGNSLSLEIINAIKDYTEDIKERNLLVWNLYVVSRELIDEGAFEEALRLIDRAEDNWSRDLILADSMGVYHISWKEQLWLRRAEIYLMSNEVQRFQGITDKILLSRMSYFKEAEGVTGETIMRDRCTYSCLELMAFEERRKSLKRATVIMKQALLHKAGDTVDIEKLKLIEIKERQGFYSNAFDSYLKTYYKIPDLPYDNIRYGYCESCKYFDGLSKCSKKNMETNEYRACTNYEI